ncbi:MAG TPA: nuclear transport factor 2 family protein [Burkholderiaceae bacterium]|jgi:hypothetical protein|nr:nuclear transport factor 2 family protein [Burkholderiaceae bacterium]
MPTPEAIVERQLAAFNARDLRAFLAEYSDDVLVYRPPGTEPVFVGKDALGRFYATERFNRPNLHASIVNRIVVGDTVIDHERIFGVKDQPFELAVVYGIAAGRIKWIWSYAAQ